MPASEVLNRLGGQKHVLLAYRAVAFNRVLRALMAVRHVYPHARVAFHAVHVVDAEAFPHAANVAAVTVIHGARRVVVPQIARLAKVFAERFVTARVNARRTHRLQRLAVHAHHFRHVVPVHRVRFRNVVTHVARVKPPTTPRHHFAPAHIMRASQLLLLLIPIHRSQFLRTKPRPAVAITGVGVICAVLLLSMRTGTIESAMVLLVGRGCCRGNRCC
mmetsp:Transcript_17353/g.37683  ORF Transcript_17353/g.37683 Transcript_17353/m.37683 type:complete len:218 (-) Transcript_17353:47-700(-)